MVGCCGEASNFRMYSNFSCERLANRSEAMESCKVKEDIFCLLIRVQHCSKPLLDLDMPQLQCFFNAGAKAPACCLGQAARAWRGKIKTKLKRKERLLPLPQLDHC